MTRTEAPERLLANLNEAVPLIDRLGQLQGLLDRYQVSAALVCEDLNLRLTSGIGDSSALDEQSLGELVMAYACRKGHPQALQDFESLVATEFEQAAGKLRISGAHRSDAKQRLWERLFIGEPDAPKILGFHGKGRLKHWFRVTCARYLLNEIRNERRERLVLESDFRELSVVGERDPELALVELSCKQHFRQAFQSALKQLSVEQRNTLRCHYLHGMSIDKMAEVFGFHRTTAARRITSARERLLEITRDNLRQVLGVSTEELNSVIRNAQGRSSLSVERLLTQADQDGEASSTR